MRTGVRRRVPTVGGSSTCVYGGTGGPWSTARTAARSGPAAPRIPPAWTSSPRSLSPARFMAGRRLHSGWVMVATGMLCVLAALGFGRFALGMLLPSMAATLPLSYAQSGYVSTGNFVGYLAAVLACGPAAGRLGARRVVIGALAAMAISMLLIARAHGFAAVLVLYTVTGVASGAVNVVVMALVARWFASERRGRAAGFVVIGSGFAIILSGWLIPFVNRTRGAEGWRTSWTVLAVSILGIAAMAALLLRERPPGASPGPGAPRPGPAPARPPGARRAVRLLAAIYFLFGY